MTYRKGFMYLKLYINFQIYPTHLRSVYGPSGPILAILHKEVPHMLQAKYQPSSSGEVVVWMVFTMYGHDGHLEFWIMACFS